MDDVSGFEFFLDGRLTRHIRVVADGSAAVLCGMWKLHGLPNRGLLRGECQYDIWTTRASLQGVSHSSRSDLRVCSAHIPRSGTAPITILSDIAM